MAAIAEPTTPTNCVTTPITAFGSNALPHSVPTRSNGSTYRHQHLTTTMRSFTLPWTWLTQLSPRQVLHSLFPTIAETTGLKSTSAVRPVRKHPQLVLRA